MLPDTLYSAMVQFAGVRSKLSVLCQIKQLKNIFTDKDKEEGMLDSAKKYAISKMYERLRNLYPDDAQVREQLEKMERGEDEFFTNRGFEIRCLYEGYFSAFVKERDKLTQDLDRRVINNRFGRAFQFFTDSIRLNNPHGYVSMASCLEILFCTSKSEITNQLALRIAWLLSPDNCEKRINIFKQVKLCYDLRSRIVHTGTYDPDSDEFVANNASLQIVTRWAFKQILSNNDVYEIFCHKDKAVSEDFLEKLPFGDNQARSE